MAGVLPATAAASSHITLHAPSKVVSGKRLVFSASSSYGTGRHEQLTLFVAHRATCGRTAKKPQGADLVFGGTVDNYLTINSFSEPLSTRGHWVLCGYLTVSGKVKAHASSGFHVV